MGDRFYTAQAKHLGKKPTKDFVEKMKDEKPKRKLKSDYIKDLVTVLGTEVSGLDKLTVDSLNQLIEAVEAKVNGQAS